MATLPLDIIINILSRLPVKPLLRFKSVSKYWYSLIKSPHFTKLHLTQTLTFNTHRHLIASHSSLSSANLDSGDENPTHLNFSDLNCPLQNSEVAGGFKLLGSCNGVILISDSEYNDLYLFNPCTKSHRKLPPLCPPLTPFAKLFGLGYDIVSDDYKVLMAIKCLDSTSELYSEANVYSLRRKSWNRVDQAGRNMFFNQCCVFVNQGVHYLVHEFEIDISYLRVVRFDVEEETYSSFDIPRYRVFNKAWKMSLGDLGGSLCLLIHVNQLEQADLWVMKNEAWVRMFSVLTAESIGVYLKIKPIVLSNDGGRVLLEVDEGEGGHFWCDLKAKTNRLEKVRVLGQPAGMKILNMWVFVESLVSLDEELMLASEHQVQG